MADYLLHGGFTSNMNDINGTIGKLSQVQDATDVFSFTEVWSALIPSSQIGSTLFLKRCGEHGEDFHVLTMDCNGATGNLAQLSETIIQEGIINIIRYTERFSFGTFVSHGILEGLDTIFISILLIFSRRCLSPGGDHEVHTEINV